MLDGLEGERWSSLMDWRARDGLAWRARDA